MMTKLTNIDVFKVDMVHSYICHMLITSDFDHNHLIKEYDLQPTLIIWTALSMADTYYEFYNVMTNCCDYLSEYGFKNYYGDRIEITFFGSHWIMSNDMAGRFCNKFERLEAAEFILERKDRWQTN